MLGRERGWAGVQFRGVLLEELLAPRAPRGRAAARAAVPLLRGRGQRAALVEDEAYDVEFERNQGSTHGHV